MISAIRRKRILGAAKQVFARHGYTGANVSMICKQAGIGRATMYNYFSGKWDVFDAIIAETVQDVSAAVRMEIPAGIELCDLMELHVKRLEKVFRLLNTNRAFAKVFFRVSAEIPALRRYIDTCFISLIAAELEDCCRAGILAADADCELLAVRMWGELERVVQHYFFSGGSGVSVAFMRELAGRITELEFAGLQGCIVQPENICGCA